MPRRAIKVALPLQQIAQQEVCRGIVGIDFEGGLKILFDQIQFTCLQRQIGQAVPGIEIKRIFRHDRQIALRGLFQGAKVFMDLAKLVMACRVPGLHLEGSLQAIPRLFMTLQGGQDNSQV